MMQRTIGILALQGDFAKHEAMLQSLGVGTIQIKYPEDLPRCSGLIIPGGESTTLTKLMAKYEFYDPIRDFARTHPIMGTCAGMIMIASHVDDDRVKPLQLIDISVHRNAYGRQIDSFTTEVNMPFLGESTVFRTIFIRAPKIVWVGSSVEILLELQEQPVMVRNPNVLALAFHPELTADPRIHRYFLDRF
jgi:5'-phosphate synthase pdxT subunit